MGPNQQRRNPPSWGAPAPSLEPPPATVQAGGLIELPVKLYVDPESLGQMARTIRDTIAQAVADGIQEGLNQHESAAPAGAADEGGGG